MKVARMGVKNFRGIENGEFEFDGHTLLLGGNNVGKSTVCEALDLCLGADRLARRPVIEEYDFYNSRYLDESGQAVELRVEVLLIDVSPTIKRTCFSYLERWDPASRRVLERGDIDKVDQEGMQWCLRVVTIGRYNEEDDEFEAHTHYASAYNPENERDSEVQRSVRRDFGFLYLRTLRTGSRALSLDRGSLLDVIIRTQSLQTGIWEGVRSRLAELDPPIHDSVRTLGPVLEQIQKRLASYVQMGSGEDSAEIFVTQLTREHLRKTLSFFLKLSEGQEPVPFQHVGTGTLNTLVLALLTFVADLKEEGVIFAMEEPEIALPPHTQRRIASYMLEKPKQCFVTSHSPYVIECFEPSMIKILRRSTDGSLATTDVDLGGSIKAKTYRRHLRRALAEAMLGAAVIIAEGVTEEAILHAAARVMEECDPDLYPLDLAGVTVVCADGDGNIAELGRFFVSLGVPTHAFLDKKRRPATEQQALAAVPFDIYCESSYFGAEALLAAEAPLDRQWGLLEDLRDRGLVDKVGVPSRRPADDVIRDLTKAALKAGKGAGWAGDLIAACAVDELPSSVTDFLSEVYRRFPRPVEISMAGLSPSLEMPEDGQEEADVAAG